jgi:hypothetical protein
MSTTAPKPSVTGVQEIVAFVIRPAFPIVGDRSVERPKLGDRSA